MDKNHTHKGESETTCFMAHEVVCHMCVNLVEDHVTYYLCFIFWILQFSLVLLIVLVVLGVDNKKCTTINWTLPKYCTNPVKRAAGISSACRSHENKVLSWYHEPMCQNVVW